MTTEATDGVTTTPVQFGWSYAVRLPRFPIVSTPRQRGGIRASLTATEAHFVLCVEANVERIFFLHAADAVGNKIACQCTVEAIPRSASNPPEVTVAAGWFVERRAGTPNWTSLMPIEIESLDVNDPVRVRLNKVIATGPGGGSGGVGS